MDAALLEIVRQARVIVLLGDKDTGKSTLARILANELYRQGRMVGILDADVGQSDVGPPTTIGFGCVTQEIEQFQDVVVQQLYFVGALTPRGHILTAVLGARKMLDFALKYGCDHVIVNTTGFIRGLGGHLLKTRKLESLAPDLILCLQRQQECEHLLKAFAPFDFPQILRLTPDPACRSRSMVERQKNRTQKLQQTFAAAQEIECALDQLIILDETAFFAGQPCTPDEWQRVTACLSAPPVTAPSAGIAASTLPLWGERLDADLHLVTARPLDYQQIAALKAACAPVDYVTALTPTDFTNVLVGVLNSQRVCCGLGLLRALNFADGKLSLLTAVPAGEIVGLQMSRCQISADDLKLILQPATVANPLVG